MAADLDRFETEPGLPRRGHGDRRWIPWAAAALVLAAAGTFWVLRRPAEAPSPESVAADPAAPAEAVPVAPPSAAAAEPLPTLDESDAFVRERAAALSAAPELEAWLGVDHLVRRFVALVATVAEGRSPREVVGFLAPAGGFRVRERAGRLYVDPASYARYDRIAGVLASVDPQAAAALWTRLRPLLDAAHREIAPPDESLEATLARALDRLLATPVPDGDVEVVLGAGAGYDYADPDLEALAPAQKHLLRMGPENARRVQAALRALRGAMGQSR